ncbi:uncharacterized protein RAG0_06978 [Rhynchosporium agropyri]|uniref:Uncharacterized protein n=1 Tax=Rhynchosporium agropyri TaxID=914238 RepID=A0A1E1KJB9_9HELO|nr:uncharacterized protein RAG0_06978 [Rhynchosporium agropyri]
MPLLSPQYKYTECTVHGEIKSLVMSAFATLAPSPKDEWTGKIFAPHESSGRRQ